MFKRLLLVLAIALFLRPVLAQAQGCELIQSTALQEISIGRFVDSTDGNTEETALTINNTDVRLKKGAADWTSKNSGGATHEEGGNYRITLDATDTATLGILEISVHVSGALSVEKTCMVVSSGSYSVNVSTGPATAPANFAATVISAGGVVNANAVQILGTAVSTPATAGILDVNVKNVDNDATSASGTVTFPNATLASTTNITAGTITTATTATNVTTVNGLAANVITAASIANDAIGATEVADGTIDAATLATDTITAAKIAADAIGASELAADAIGDSEVATGAIATTAFAAGAIDAAAIATNAIGAAEIADAAIDLATYASDLTQTIYNRRNTAQAGAAGTITLDASASAVDDFYNNQILAILSGTGAGQARIISDYVGSTKVATVNGNWATNPSSDSVFALYAFGAIAGSSVPTVVEIRQEIDTNSTQLAKLGTPAGASISADILVLDNFVDDLESRLGTPSNLGGGATVAFNLSDIEAQTDDIGAAGAGLTALASQASVNIVDDFLDTEVAAILAAVDTEVAAIKVKTDSLTFTTANQVDSQVLAIASAAITAASIATDAIGAAEIADAAVGASELAADAVTEIKTSIQTGLLYLPKNVAATKIPLIPYDSTGVIIKTASALACEGSLDGAAFAALTTPNYVERETGGAQGAVWTFDLVQAETNGKRLFVLCTGTNMVATPVIIEFQQ